ncbi:hypothetical protein [Aquibacillus rhizosphaerae]|uniref:Uncharacterized protein n=1 Tax=Aquibacillus rhizosphaerae TaxID=3051431 RepID=A0ABT7L115_9BACI|nr:hypothetical protein [Aquibacillus sp. LR5S19]MDL4838867.1 hypothetical protein [Aquibacillus sp. LR5S19]
MNTRITLLLAWISNHLDRGPIVETVSLREVLDEQVKQHTNSNRRHAIKSS